MIRRNADEGQRELERAVAQGDVVAAHTLVRSYIRTGKINEGQIQVLASLKAEPYRSLAEELGLEVEPLTDSVMRSSLRMREFLDSLDTGEFPTLNAVDLMLSAAGLVLKFPGEFGGPAGVERATSMLRLMELVRRNHSVPIARILWRAGTSVARRRRGAHGPMGHVTSPSEWQEEHGEAASAHILHSVLFPASRVVVVFCAHEVADENGMGHGRIGQWWNSAGHAIHSVFTTFPPGSPALQGGEEWGSWHPRIAVTRRP